jgi:hypothetical protein
MKLIRVLMIVICVCALAACKKDKPVYSETPEITFVSVSNSSVDAYGQPLTFIISYQDGDGDLGENSSDAHNLFLTDNRFGITYPYRISQLAPTTSLIIKGQLKIILDNVGTTSTSPQNATFSIYVVDRAGHISNTVTSSVITVNP